MSNEVEMRIANSADDLSEEKASFIFGNIVVLDVVIEFAPFGQLHDDEDVVGGVEHFIELDDVLVADEFQDFDFSLDLRPWNGTLDMRFLFFILRLLMIFMATFTPVRSCFASEYTAPLHLTLANPPVPIVLPKM